MVQRKQRYFEPAAIEMPEHRQRRKRFGVRREIEGEYAKPDGAAGFARRDFPVQFVMDGLQRRFQDLCARLKNIADVGRVEVDRMKLRRFAEPLREP